MSNSTAIVIVSGKSRVYLYAHWAGADVIRSAKKGLKSGRVGDASYLARIIFSSMVKLDLDEETGFGISASRIGTDYPFIVIDGESKTGSVWLEDQFTEKPLTEPVSAVEFLKAAKGLGKAEGQRDFDKLQERLPVAKRLLGDQAV